MIWSAFLVIYVCAYLLKSVQSVKCVKFVSRIDDVSEEGVAKGYFPSKSKCFYVEKMV